jgi:hypothetical protein
MIRKQQCYIDGARWLDLMTMLYDHAIDSGVIIKIEHRVTMLLRQKIFFSIKGEDAARKEFIRRIKIVVARING